MPTVELYAHVRRYVAVDHHSQREAARHFGISRDMVAKMLVNAQPPGYRRTAPVARPKLDPFLGWIREILKTDQGKHRKQRHTAQRIFERLRDEHGYTGGYTVHLPGHAQVDSARPWWWLAASSRRGLFWRWICRTVMRPS